MYENKSNIFVTILSIILIAFSIFGITLTVFNYKPVEKIESESSEINTIELTFISSKDRLIYRKYEIHQNDEFGIVMSEHVVGGGWTYVTKLKVFKDGIDVSSEYPSIDLIPFTWGYNWQVYQYELLVGYSFSSPIYSDIYEAWLVNNPGGTPEECLNYYLELKGENSYEVYNLTGYIEELNARELAKLEVKKTVQEWWDTHPEYAQWRAEYNID